VLPWSAILEGCDELSKNLSYSQPHDSILSLPYNWAHETSGSFRKAPLSLPTKHIPATLEKRPTGSRIKSLSDGRYRNGGLCQLANSRPCEGRMISLLRRGAAKSFVPNDLVALNASFMCYHKQASRFFHEVLVMYHSVIFTEWYRH
jgi:hypothetical protein